MWLALLAAIGAFVIALLVTPIIRKVAIRFGILASPNHRTVHKNRTPKLGGISLFLAFSGGLVVYAYLSGHGFGEIDILAGAGLVLLVGLLDDVWGLNCYAKLVGQMISALLAVFLGFAVETIYLPLGISWELGNLALPFSILWIVAITNAVNLLDGLDGLASGVSVVTALFVLCGALIFYNLETAAVALILIMSALGFLRYNYSPARIFMGDSGSLFLGFTLACLSVRAFTLPDSGSHMAVMSSLFFIPLTDTSIAIWRRRTQGQSTFAPDKKHIHHRLLEFGLKHSTAALVFYAATFVCGLISLLLFVASDYVGLLALAIFLPFFISALIYLGCFDFLVNKRTRKDGL